MPALILYFDEYEADGEFGKVHPYLESDGSWKMDGRRYTLEEIGQRCNIPTEELLVMKLTYGPKGIH